MSEGDESGNRKKEMSAVMMTKRLCSLAGKFTKVSMSTE